MVELLPVDFKGLSTFAAASQGGAHALIHSKSAAQGEKLPGYFLLCIFLLSSSDDSKQLGIKMKWIGGGFLYLG